MKKINYTKLKKQAIKTVLGTGFDKFSNKITKTHSKLFPPKVNYHSDPELRHTAKMAAAEFGHDTAEKMFEILKKELTNISLITDHLPQSAGACYECTRYMNSSGKIVKNKKEEIYVPLLPVNVDNLRKIETIIRSISSSNQEFFNILFVNDYAHLFTNKHEFCGKDYSRPCIGLCW